MRCFIAFVALTAALCAPAQAQSLSRVDVHVSASSLSGGNTDWSEASAAVSMRWSADLIAIFKLEHSERFGLSDDYVEARVERRDGQRITYLSLGGAPDAAFRPEASLRAGLAAPLTPRWQGLVDLDLSRFGTGDVASLRVGAERRWHWADATAQVFLVGLSGDGERLVGHGARLEAQAAPQVRMRIGYADAPEVSENRVTQVVSWSLSALLDLNDAVTLRADLTAEDRGLYDRLELGAGAAWRF